MRRAIGTTRIFVQLPGKRRRARRSRHVSSEIYVCMPFTLVPGSPLLVDELQTTRYPAKHKRRFRSYRSYRSYRCCIAGRTRRLYWWRLYWSFRCTNRATSPTSYLYVMISTNSRNYVTWICTAAVSMIRLFGRFPSVSKTWRPSTPRRRLESWVIRYFWPSDDGTSFNVNHSQYPERSRKRRTTQTRKSTSMHAQQYELQLYLLGTVHHHTCVCVL